MTPHLIFGTASFGMDQTDFQDASRVSSLVEALQGANINRLDSGARYPPLNPGRAEELIGESKEFTSSFLVDTKVYTDTQTDGSGDLTSEAIDKSINTSLSRLQRISEGVNTLHIHRADPSTPLQEQVRAFNEQIQKGNCKEWGVSNVPVPMLENMLQICDEEGLQKPSCYQGDYNVITRGMETQLLPILRKHNMVFNAFRPLASGFLTGKFVKGEHAGTRFGDDNPLGKFAQNLFGSETLHTAMKRFGEECAAQNFTTAEVALRWVFHHSALGDGDGVIIGASRKQHVTESVTMLQKGPLPSAILKLTEEFWDSVKASRDQIM